MGTVRVDPFRVVPLGTVRVDPFRVAWTLLEKTRSCSAVRPAMAAWAALLPATLAVQASFFLWERCTPKGCSSNSGPPEPTMSAHRTPRIQPLAGIRTG